MICNACLKNKIIFCKTFDDLVSDRTLNAKKKNNSEICDEIDLEVHWSRVGRVNLHQS